MSELRLEEDKAKGGNREKGKRGDSVKAEETAWVLDEFFFEEDPGWGAALSIILLFLRWRLADSDPGYVI
jgi:hypothetical protein